jgi:hypothetical protein
MKIRKLSGVVFQVNSDEVHRLVGSELAEKVMCEKRIRVVPTTSKFGLDPSAEILKSHDRVGPIFDAIRWSYLARSLYPLRHSAVPHDPRQIN